MKKTTTKDLESWMLIAGKNNEKNPKNREIKETSETCK